MADHSFKPSAENFEILRQRIKEFTTRDMPTWGAGRLLKETRARHNQDPETYRSAINKFVDGRQQTIEVGVASALWEFFLTNYPNEILNSQGVYIDISTHRMSHILRHYYEVDKKKASTEYANALTGDYIILQQAWALDNHFSIGRLKFEAAPQSDGHVILANEWVSGRLANKNMDGKIDPEIEISTGYAFPKGPNIFVFMKTEGAQPRIITIETVTPEPKRRTPFRVLEGSIYAAIGKGPHWTTRFVAHRIEPGRSYEICTKRMDSDIMKEFGYHGLYWVKYGDAWE